MKAFQTGLLVKVLIVFIVLILYPVQGKCQSLDDFNTVVDKYSANSPAGGPKKNADAAVFVFFRASKKLCWVAGGKVVSVETQPPQQIDDTREGGPTPVGEYLIGQRFANQNYNGLDWYKLYPRIENNSGYYGYAAKTKPLPPGNMGRNLMGLHPGAVSLGCVTVKSPMKPYDSIEAWKSVRTKLDSSKLKYKDGDYSGLLYVEDN